MVKVNYSANNSGGSWWLEDKDWHALEAAGWTVLWYKDEKDGLTGSLVREGRFLGTLARGASKNFETPEQGIEEWQQIVGQDPWEEGCNCCGQPHNFSYEDKDGNEHYPNVVRSNSFNGWH